MRRSVSPCDQHDTHGRYMLAQQLIPDVSATLGRLPAVLYGNRSGAALLAIDRSASIRPVRSLSSRSAVQLTQKEESFVAVMIGSKRVRPAETDCIKYPQTPVHLIRMRPRPSRRTRGALSRALQGTTVPAEPKVAFTSSASGRTVESVRATSIPPLE
jgi:ribosomal protein L25 (general stress protein Ctc)